MTTPRASPPKKAAVGLSGSGPGRAKTVEITKINKSYEKAEKVKIMKNGKNEELRSFLTSIAGFILSCASFSCSKVTKMSLVYVPECQVEIVVVKRLG